MIGLHLFLFLFVYLKFKTKYKVTEYKPFTFHIVLYFLESGPLLAYKMETTNLAKLLLEIKIGGKYLAKFFCLFLVEKLLLFSRKDNLIL